MELDVTATEPREAAWLVMQRVRWEAVFGADRVPPSGPWRRLLLAPSLENLARLRGARRTSSSSPPRQRLLSVPGRQEQQQEGGESSAASVLTTGSGTSRLVSVHNIVRFPSPSRIGSRESLWVRSRRRWRGAVPTPVSRAWRSIRLGRARGVVIAPSPGERPERPTTRSMIVLG
ncbi:hypothetical protein GGTG_14213 [Gaeumannomyces tritici R3-111a-1]|uniref:Uncharacterized protein n=1 Tax=Gaeumannomyces tritici (strain R3-111a-1) TaxID=644352 RepID=J3PKY7_GAET3|nr:hypothetical protein GGTG_14213 [Gaeumannomyces tritici R3-111a-1]EJT68209.1 hypothetical protein GGTG_14213 [Gaeumannomyces tritici R3-111a-1]